MCLYDFSVKTQDGREDALSEYKGDSIMTVAVRYFSRTGNTKKLAECVAVEAGVNAETVDVPLSEKVDVLFLGSAVYAAGVDPAIKNFISANKDKIGAIVNISTAALLSSTYKQVKKFAESQGVQICEKEFHCRGAFASMHKGRPNADDLEKAKLFVKSVLA